MDFKSCGRPHNVRIVSNLAIGDRIREDGRVLVRFDGVHERLRHAREVAVRGDGRAYTRRGLAEHGRVELCGRGRRGALALAATGAGGRACGPDRRRAVVGGGVLRRAGFGFYAVGL